MNIFVLDENPVTAAKYMEAIPWGLQTPSMHSVGG